MKKFKECGNRHADMEGQKEGSYMVARNLHAIKHALDEIMPLVDEHDEIESWIEHKISVAKDAISSVRDALTYDADNDCACGCGGNCGCGGEDGEAVEVEVDEEQPVEGDVEIEVLEPGAKPMDQFGLSKIFGAMGANNENKYFLGSGAINENRQLVANNSKKKIIVESMKKAGNRIRVKTKAGNEYEYVPHFGAELEMLRCEDYGIKIKKTK
jgi:hypothetical protein